MTPQDYLDWESAQPLKYEYLNGQVHAMTGGTLPHNSISLNVAAALKNHLRGQGCKVFMADAKVGVSEKGPFFYPDIMVTCDTPIGVALRHRHDQTARQVVYHPCLIVEVLSPGTAHLDQGRKFRNYRRIETLKEYVLIEADTMNVDCYRLNEKGKWELTAYSPEDAPEDTNPNDLEVHFTSIDFHGPMSLIYEDVLFSESDAEAFT